MNIEVLRNVPYSNIIWTTHVRQKMFEQSITEQDVFQCIAKGEIIEDYPEDFPHPSCLIYGFDVNERIIHVVADFYENELFVIIAYIPDEIRLLKDLKTSCVFT